MKREVMLKGLQDKSSTSPNPAMDATRSSMKLPFQLIKNQRI
jgi:hypothetical protein